MQIRSGRVPIEPFSPILTKSEKPSIVLKPRRLTMRWQKSLAFVDESTSIASSLPSGKNALWKICVVFC
uniref:Uncharacterized protein n=1 Tax=Ascaris lumbricoides TaxID=6252 RepID=A0A0M3HKH3_ASCLU